MLERELGRLSPEASWRTTRVWLNVDAEGIVRSVEIAESSGNSQLDAIVLRVVRHLRCEPALRDVKPVEARVPYSVTLTGPLSPHLRLAARGQNPPGIRPSMHPVWTASLHLITT